jgi:hypothetical protein
MVETLRDAQGQSAPLAVVPSRQRSRNGALIEHQVREHPLQRTRADSLDPQQIPRPSKAPEPLPQSNDGLGAFGSDAR